MNMMHPQSDFKLVSTWTRNSILQTSGFIWSASKEATSKSCRLYHVWCGVIYTAEAGVYMYIVNHIGVIIAGKLSHYNKGERPN